MTAPMDLAGLAVLGLGWAFHVWRLRTRERRLLAAIERVESGGRVPAGPETPAPLSASPESAEPGPAEQMEPHRVLVVSHADVRDDLSRRLVSQGFEPSFADSVWAARAAWRVAVADDRPYNLILLDETGEAFDDAALADELQHEFDREGARVGSVRARRPDVSPR